MKMKMKEAAMIETALLVIFGLSAIVVTSGVTGFVIGDQYRLKHHAQQPPPSRPRPARQRQLKAKR